MVSDYWAVGLMDKKGLAALIERIKPRVVVNCAEGNYNDLVYEACLETKTHVIDLGSDIALTRKQLNFHADFERAGIIGITGCGATPGINNVMLEFALRDFDAVETIEAGFAWDSNIKVFVTPFSIESIIQELTHPAPYIENNVWKERINPLEKSKKRRFQNIGTQECFVVHHPETYTFQEYAKEKGVNNIRFYAGFPQHSLSVLKILAQTGLGSEEPADALSGNEYVKIRPLDLVSQALMKNRPPIGYREIEILWVRIRGKRKGKMVNMKMECMVETQKGWEFAGSNINTGITVAVIAEMIRNGEITAKGSFAPEQVIPERALFTYLSGYGMKFFKNGRLIT